MYFGLFQSVPINKNYDDEKNFENIILTKVEGGYKRENRMTRFSKH